tara:strand:+ start:12199 stop:13893 length:1695 start_codon:yes stop_codon:yes gene_type:complete
MVKTHKKKGKSKRLSKRRDVAAGPGASTMKKYNPEYEISIADLQGNLKGSVTAKSKTTMKQLKESLSEGREPNSDLSTEYQWRSHWDMTARNSSIPRGKRTVSSLISPDGKQLPGNTTVKQAWKSLGQDERRLNLTVLDTTVNLVQIETKLKNKFNNLFRLLLNRYIISCKIYEFVAYREKVKLERTPPPFPLPEVIQHLFIIAPTYQELINQPIEQISNTVNEINVPTEPTSDEKLSEIILQSKEVIYSHRNYLKEIKRLPDPITIKEEFDELPFIIYVDKLFSEDSRNNTRSDVIDTNFTADRWRYIWTHPADRRLEDAGARVSYWGMHGELPGELRVVDGQNIEYMDFVEAIIETINESLFNYKLLEIFYDIQRTEKNARRAQDAYNKYYRELEEKMDGSIFRTGDIKRYGKVKMYFFIKTVLTFIFLTIKKVVIDMTNDPDFKFKDKEDDIILDYNKLANTLSEKLDSITYIELLKELKIIQDNLKSVWWQGSKPLSRPIRPVAALPRSAMHKRMIRRLLRNTEPRVVPAASGSGTKKKRKPKKKPSKKKPSKKKPSKKK